MVYAKSPNSNLDGLVTATCNFAISDLGFFFAGGLAVFFVHRATKTMVVFDQYVFFCGCKNQKTTMTVCDVFFVFSARASEHMKFFFFNDDAVQM